MKIKKLPQQHLCGFSSVLLCYVLLKWVWIAACSRLVAFLKLFVQVKKTARRHVDVFCDELALAYTELYSKKEIICIMFCSILEIEFCCLLSLSCYFSVFWTRTCEFIVTVAENILFKNSVSLLFLINLSLLGISVAHGVPRFFCQHTSSSRVSPQCLCPQTW